jgi:hypothetical protein
MAANPEIWIAIAGMALVSYACRAGGYWAMGFVRMTARVEGWLAAMPSALVAAILARAGERGAGRDRRRRRRVPRRALPRRRLRRHDGRHRRGRGVAEHRRMSEKTANSRAARRSARSCGAH